MEKEPLETIQQILSIATDFVILGAAFVAAIKFKVFALWKHSYRTELECKHSEIPPNGVIFTADYRIINTGERPLRIGRVRLSMYRSKQVKGGHLVPDSDNQLVPATVFTEHEVKPSEHPKRIGQLGDIKKSERSIFTLRCQLKELPAVVFVVGEFEWERDTLQTKMRPTRFVGIYVKALSAQNLP